jgi:hypothetical protein
MQQTVHPWAASPNGLREAMQKLRRRRAVIRSEANRIVIEFSDGHVHLLEYAQYLARDQLIVAAVHWCRRHGVDVVEICS